MKVHLHFYDDTSWTNDENIHFRGKGISGDSMLSDDNIIQKIQDVTSIDSGAELSKQLNGLFAWVKIETHSVLLSVDHHRSVPLYYAIQGDEIWISDYTEWIYQQIPEASLDDVMAAEYLILGYITGNRTLSREIMQVEAGTIIEIKDDSGTTNVTSNTTDNTSLPKGSHREKSSNIAERNHPYTKLKIKTNRFFRFLHRYRDPGRRQFLHDFDDIVLQTMQRVIDYATGRPIVVPLSGGLDSRLIALTLSRLRYPDVRCYTFGQRGSKEASISKTIAGKLNFPWTQVIYTQEKWRNWFHSYQRRLYYRHGSRHARIPNLLEFGAQKELRKENIIPDDSVIVGGHHGFLTSGKGEFDNYTYREHPEVNEDTIIPHILHYNYHLWDWSNYHNTLHPFFRQRILNTLDPLESYPDSPGACEAWFYYERQAKFVVQAARLYEFFGYDWWMPYCDMDYLRFWLEMPLIYRQDKSLYTNYISLISPFDIPEHAAKKKILSIRNKIKNTPIFSPVQKGYQHYLRRKRKKNEYKKHPMAWYGIMNKTDFNMRFTGRENLNSFQSLELLRIIFENGFLSIDDILGRAVSILEEEAMADHSQ